MSVSTMKTLLGLILTLVVLEVYSDNNYHQKDIESEVNLIGEFIQESFNGTDKIFVPQPHEVFKNPKRALKKLSNFKSSSKCKENFLDFAEGLYQRESWALDMLDAYGKIESGISLGNIKWPGRFSLCISIVQNESYPNPIRGQYCWLDFNLKQDNQPSAGLQMLQGKISLRVGICVPSSCKPSEINDVMNLINDISLIKTYGSASVDCIPSSRNIWEDNKAVACLAFCFSIVVIICIGTILDVYTQCVKRPSENSKTVSTSKEFLALSIVSVNESKSATSIEETANSTAAATGSHVASVKQQPGVCRRFLLSFSVYTNASKLFSCTVNANTLTCLTGIRVLSICWIILGHSYLLGGGSADNPLQTIEWLQTFSFLFVGQGSYAVDTFFVLSGLLVTYLYLKEHQKCKGKISWIKFYVHRYWRLTPVYIVIMFIFETLLSPYYANGPFWPSETDGNCEKYWWWNLLYINNFQPMNQMCMGHAWYLANDMQFYVLSPIILIFLTRFVPVSAIICLGLILSNWVVTAVIADYYNIGFSILELGENNHMFDKIYTKPYNRMAAYIIGMICGYILFKGKCKTKLSKKIVIIGWLLAIGLSYSVFFGAYKADMSRPLTLLYLAVSRSCWAIALAWMIFACCNGYGGIVDNFLSWPLWQPFGRLTYTVYLIHMVIVRLFVSGTEVQTHFSHLAMITIFLASTVSSFFAAVFLSLAFEAPFLALEKLVL